MANGDKTWLERTILIAGYSLALGLGYLGYDSITSSIHDIKCLAEVRSKVVDEKLEKATERDQMHLLAIKQLQIYMTMNYEQRIKALQNLEKMQVK